MSKIRSLSRAVVALTLVVATSGCAYTFKEDAKATKQPINCATAEGDLRMLASEKANLAEQIAMGVTAIVPVGLVIGVVTMTEGTKVKVATGEYNKMIDARIAEIKSTCNVQ